MSEYFPPPPVNNSKYNWAVMASRKDGSTLPILYSLYRRKAPAEKDARTMNTRANTTRYWVEPWEPSQK